MKKNYNPQRLTPELEKSSFLLKISNQKIYDYFNSFWRIQLLSISSYNFFYFSLLFENFLAIRY